MIDVDALIRQALKGKQRAVLLGYRSLKAKIGAKLTEAGRGTDTPLTENEQQALIAREIKERKESNEFLAPDAPAFAENTQIIEALQAHLPPQLDGEALEAAVRKVIADTGAENQRDMGKVMAALRQVPGVEMGAASARVKALLAGQG